MKKETVSFEASFRKLQEILVKLENEIESCSLEDMIQNYQEGLKLIKLCRSKLAEAELIIEKISTEEDV